MPRSIEIIHTIKISGVVGLVAPARRPQTHIFDLTLLDGLQKPDYFRWSWNPIFGELLVGTMQHHQYQMPRHDPNRPFESYLRGFYFVKEKLVAMRPFSWPETPYDDFDPAMDMRITAAAVKLLGEELKGVKFETGVDDRWLMKNFSKYATSW